MLTLGGESAAPESLHAHAWWRELATQGGACHPSMSVLTPDGESMAPGESVPPECELPFRYPVRRSHCARVQAALSALPFRAPKSNTSRPCMSP
ncbi:MAG: hypothetical protein CHACPFDD_01297 [Phycisphaerae bacterium]|nr:hypothetical protein [Phycisphaerae bacterium]